MRNHTVLSSKTCSRLKHKLMILLASLSPFIGGKNCLQYHQKAFYSEVRPALFTGACSQVSVPRIAQMLRMQFQRASFHLPGVLCIGGKSSTYMLWFSIIWTLFSDVTSCAQRLQFLADDDSKGLELQICRTVIRTSACTEGTESWS